MISFYVPAGRGESALTEKRSRFLGHVKPVDSEEAARAFLQEIRKEYHDARHNCWCWRIYDGLERFSDDGEPQGSAGMPMLEVFRRENIWNIACVVTRYFGGVLLGTGGLSRAYSGAAKEALLAAGLTECGEWKEIRFSCAYSILEVCRNELLAAGARMVDTGFGTDVQVTAQLPGDAAERIRLRLRELSGGKVLVEISEDFVRG